MNAGLSVLFRIFLIAGSLGTILFFLRKIRKAKVQIQDVLFWIAFSGILLILSLFPGILSFLTGIMGIESPANFLFLVIIFLLLVHQFTLTIKVSMLENKLNQLGRKTALESMESNNLEGEKK